MKRFAFAMWMLGTALASGAAAKPKPPVEDTNARVGMVTRVIRPAAQRNWRGADPQQLNTVIWYPANDGAIETRQTIGEPGRPLFEAGSAMPDAPFAPHLEKLPLIVISHGSGGSAQQMAWLGTALARAGYIAVAVDHPGNNAVAKLTPEGFALWWERATDLTNVIDALLKDQTFGQRIDATRIAAAGYSLGGYTVLELAGAQTDIAQFFDRCRPHTAGDAGGTADTSRPNDDAAVCHTQEMRGMGSIDEILQTVRKTSRESLARSGGSYRDPRVKAVFAIAPALGFTQTPDSLRAIHLPVEIVVGTEDRIAPANENADYLRANLKAGRETTFPGVSHYTFLGTCTAQGAALLPQYCTDPPGIDRDKVHAQVAAMAIKFFDRELKWR